MILRRKGFGTALLAAVLAGSMLLGGCGQKEEGGASSADTKTQSGTPESSSQADSGEQTEEKEDVEENSGYKTTYGDKQFDNVTIKVEVFDRSNAPEGSTVTDNRWTEYINQEMNKVGISVEFVAVPRSEEFTKLQTMMATDTAPDIVFAYGDAENYYDDGGTYNLSEYVDGEDQARNLKAYVTDEVLDYGRNSKGELFAVTARRSTGAMMESFIRKDWLDALELEIPTTVEELHTVLKAFKENYPECVPYYSTQFGVYSVSPLAHSFLKSVSDGKLYESNYWNFLYADDGAVEYVRFLNTLYNEGLVEPEYYTVADTQAEAGKLMVNGQVGVLEANVNSNVALDRGALLQTLKQSNPEAEYVSIPPLVNVNDGQIYNPGYALNGLFIFIPKTSKNVEACITYLDWLATQEGGFTLYHGFEGEHFQYENGIPVAIDSDYNAKDKDWTNNDLFLVGNGGYFMTDMDFMQSTAQGYGEWKDYVIENYVNATAGTVRSQTVYTAPSHRENATELGLALDENLVKCITCAPEEFDANVEAYRAALKEAGGDEVQKEYEEYYNSFD